MATSILPATYEHYTHSDQLTAAILGISDNYRYHVRQFVEWLGGRDLTAEAVQAYFVALNDSQYSAGTKRVKRAAVKKRLRQLARMGGLGSDISRNLDQFLKDLDAEPATKAPKVNTVEVGSEKVVSHEEYLLLVHHARSRRQVAFIKFLWATGCRVSEMCGIRRGDWDLGEKAVRIRVNGKGSKERWVRIPRGLFDEIRAIFAGEEWLFETSGGKALRRSYVSDQIARLGRDILRRKISAHTFRHTFATRMIRETRKVQAVSKYLGHSSPSITLSMYVHEELDDAELFSEALA